MILSALKKANDNQRETNALMALGMDKDAAKAFSRRIVKSYKQSGATGPQKKHASGVI